MESEGAICEGGGCDYRNPKETLREGYCPGEGCLLNGRPHPTFKEKFVTE